MVSSVREYDSRLPIHSIHVSSDLGMRKGGCKLLLALLQSHRFLKSEAIAALGILIVAWKSIPDSLSKMSSVHGGLSGTDFCTSSSVCIANVCTLGLERAIERALGKE